MLIISAERKELDQTSNQARGQKLRTSLHILGYSYTSAEGMYKGSREDSVVVDVDQVTPILRALLVEYDQESALLVDRDNNASLVYTSNGLVQPLGTWTKVDESDAAQSGNYTRIGHRYYTTK